jgi:uncharacterized protein (UPF0261 family)
MNPTVVLIGTLDTKGDELAFLRDIVQREGCAALVVDVGTLHPPTIEPDVLRSEVASAAGWSEEEIVKRKDRRFAVETMIEGGSKILSDLFTDGRVCAALSVGGGTGTHIGMGIMRRLPLGVGKLMVSTVASRDMSQLIGTKDIVVMHSVIDILGLNPISERILENAGTAAAAMARSYAEIRSERPILGLTSFGFITEGAMRLQDTLEARGYAVAAFHANGTGGMAMEDLIEQGLISGVVDFALHEFADAMHGGYCGGIGPGRLEAAGRAGIPQVVVPGGLDCIVLEFSSEETRPPQFKGRKVFWYDFRSGVRTSREEILKLAETVAGKLGIAQGPVSLLIPLQGWSEADRQDGPLFEPETNAAFISEARRLLDGKIKIEEVDAHINDKVFTDAVASEIDSLMRAR